MFPPFDSQTLSTDIDVKVRKIDKLQNSLQYWRAKLATDTREAEERCVLWGCARAGWQDTATVVVDAHMRRACRNTRMRQEKEAVSLHFQSLKSRMNGQRESQKRRLTELANTARSTSDALQERNELAERVIGLSERARLLETEREKVRVAWHKAWRRDDSTCLAALLARRSRRLLWRRSLTWTN